MVTWRSACSYALTVVIGSWVTGAAVGLAWSVVMGGLGFWVSLWVTNPASYVFLAGATLTLVATRRFTRPLPVWRAVLVDGGAYLLVLLLWAGLYAWWGGAAVPVDDAFAVAGFAMLHLQLPAAWVLSFWRARHLHAVPRHDGGPAAAAPAAGP
ncbi:MULTISPECIES: hypothetical protein [Streptomyces]|uniref:DUF4175 domain-containing protein n=1 Tax=Streptomyces sudanensis TaxID=436397 RepID=A0ABY4TEX8_9ACTN|nr:MULTISPECIES: hypothetical protein [Streptomyces]URN15565.1 hypothetical protein MW084_05915 [Streptomyces sudanensis]